VRILAGAEIVEAGATCRAFFFLVAASAAPMPTDNAAITAIRILVIGSYPCVSLLQRIRRSNAREGNTFCCALFQFASRYTSM
jgi:hypothetical protein